MAWLRLRTDVGWGDGLAVAAGVSLVSHPVFWFVYAPHAGPGLGALVLGEGLVVATEAVAYRLALRIPTREALGVSLLTNVVSATLGSLVYRALFVTI